MKRGISKSILKLIRESSRPISTREIAQKTKVAWHTADRYCLKLQLARKVDCFTIGNSTAWFEKRGKSY